MSEGWIRFAITANGTVGFALLSLYAHSGDKISLVLGVLNLAAALFSLAFGVTKAVSQ